MNFSKLSVLSLATASALAAAGQAAAFPVDWATMRDNTNGMDNSVVMLWHSGATASTSSLQTAVVEAFCDTAQAVDILEDARSYTTAPNPAGATDILKAGVAKPDFWSVACIGKATLPIDTLAGKQIVWSKRDEGGSGTGVGPLATFKPIGYMKPSVGDINHNNIVDVGDVANANCPGNDAVTTRNYPRTVAGVSTTVWNCTGFAVPALPALPLGGAADPNDTDPTADGVSRVSDIGTSDIEAAKFTSNFPINVPASDFNLNGTRGPTDPDDVLAIHDDVGTVPGTVALVKEGMAQLTFNTPVNILMYQDLQRAQFPSGHQLNNDCFPGNAGYGSIANKADNANSEKCMPSLTASEIRSIMGKGGAVRSTKDFLAESPYGSATFAELDAMVTSLTTDNTIQICRRVNGSGTQAQFNAMLLGYPCDATFDSSIDTLVPEAEGALTTFVSENESSGDVEKCLNDFNNATNGSTKNAALRKRWAIGVQSLEKNAPSATTGLFSNAYRFIKIDGFAPTLANVHAGDYFDVGQQTLQYKSGALTVTVDAFATVKPYIQDPLKLPVLNKDQAFGKSGWLASPSATYTPDSVLNLSRPVAWFRRVSSANPNLTNTCALPSAYKKTVLTPNANNPDVTTGTAVNVGPQNCTSNGGADGNCYTP